MSFWRFVKKDKPTWKQEYSVLAGYNAEVSRGIVHTKEWKKRMKILQKDYDENYTLAQVI